MNTRLLFVHALSPLHAGTGQSYGPVDLAIARDKATDFPYLPGTSIKGSLRDLAFARAANEDAKKKLTALFGPDTKNASDHAGILAFGDANLLLLPVRSVRGTFAWVTSPYLLARFARDAKAINQSCPSIPNPDSDECYLTPKSKETIANKKKVFFEDLDLKAKETNKTKDWAVSLAQSLFPSRSEEDAFWKNHFQSHFCIVDDDTMVFLARFGTDIVTRNVLDPDTKTVDNLWDEENLPAESVLVSLCVSMPNKGAAMVMGKEKLSEDDIFALLEEQSSEVVQFGGKATVGRGRCRLVVQGG